jgi:hypothetical protein
VITASGAVFCMTRRGASGALSGSPTKVEFRFDHYEPRGWLGWHHEASQRSTKCTPSTNLRLKTMNKSKIGNVSSTPAA